MSVYKNNFSYYLTLKPNYNLKYKIEIISSQIPLFYYLWLSLKIVHFEIITSIFRES